MELPRRVRLALVVGLGAFFLIGPAYPQAFGGAARSAQHPFNPMAWRMYHSTGADLCQASFFEMKGGVRTPLPTEGLAAAIPRRRNRSRYSPGRKVRSNDVLLGAASDVAEVAPAVCALTTSRDVRVIMRCSPVEPGAWFPVDDGSQNICDREPTKAKSAPEPDAPATPGSD